MVQELFYFICALCFIDRSPSKDDLFWITDDDKLTLPIPEVHICPFDKKCIKHSVPPFNHVLSDNIKENNRPSLALPSTELSFSRHGCMQAVELTGFDEHATETVHVDIEPISIITNEGALACDFGYVGNSEQAARWSVDSGQSCSAFKEPSAEEKIPDSVSDSRTVCFRNSCSSSPSLYESLQNDQRVCCTDKHNKCSHSLSSERNPSLPVPDDKNFDKTNWQQHGQCEVNIKVGIVIILYLIII